MRFGEERVKFGTLCGNFFSLTPLEFNKWPSDNRTYSIHNIVETHNSEWKLVWDYKAVSSYPNPGGMGLGLEVFEQLSSHSAIVFYRYRVFVILHRFCMLHFQLFLKYNLFLVPFFFTPF